MMDQTNHPYNALGVFIYAGGFTLGVRQHFNVLAHLEDGPFGVATVKKNMPYIDINTSPNYWQNTINKYVGKVHLVHSNPPCAPWSMAGRATEGKRGLTNSDDRVKCVFQSYSAFERLGANAWIWESVARTADAGRPVIEQLANRGAKNGFATTVIVFEGQDCGVPQKRKRTFVVQHDFEIPWHTPDTARRCVRDVLTDDIKFDPIYDTANMSTAERNILPHTKEGGSLRDTFNKIHGTPLVDPNRQIIKGRPSFIRRRLHRDQPSFTVVGGPHLFHPTEERLLSVPEVAALCCYPPEYEFVGRINDRYAQIAKAVLPPSGAWIASNLRRGLERDVDTPNTDLTYIDFTVPATRKKYSAPAQNNAAA
jgi:site-specific DNA-cytosine methylase